MSKEFNSEGNVCLERNPKGNGIKLIHTHESLFIPGENAKIVAYRYLENFGRHFGLRKEHLKKIILSDIIENQQAGTTTVSFYQAERGFPVWQAGILVQMRLKSLRVLIAISTIHFGLQVKIPSKQIIAKAGSISEDEFLRLVLCMKNESPDSFEMDFKYLKIEERSPVIYRFEKPEQFPFSNIRESGHYVCMKIIFDLRRIFVPAERWVAMLEAESLSILYIGKLTGSFEQLVLENDSTAVSGTASIPGH